MKILFINLIFLLCSYPDNKKILGKKCIKISIRIISAQYVQVVDTAIAIFNFFFHRP